MAQGFCLKMMPSCGRDGFPGGVGPSHRLEVSGMGLRGAPASSACPPLQQPLLLERRRGIWDREMTGSRDTSPI